MKATSTESTVGHSRVSRTRTPRSDVISVPWGPEGALELAIPTDGVFAGADVDVVRPDLSGLLPDYTAALEQALDSPLGMAKLESLVGPGARVAIVVDDPSRWTPVREALPIVLERLHAAGVGREDVTITVGVGRHHAVDPETMARRLGDEIADAYPCYSPPVDDLSAYVDLGSTPQGVPVRIFRPVAQADLRILIGSVLPHLQAGFGGGYKLIFPGTSHRTTLGALHRQGLRRPVGYSWTSGGPGGHQPHAAGHPRRGRATRSLLLDQPPGWSAGSGFAGGRRSTPSVYRTCWRTRRVGGSSAVDVGSRDLIVAGNHPWPGDPMQSFKVLLHHRIACRPGGVLVGLFWTDPA